MRLPEGLVITGIPSGDHDAKLKLLLALERVEPGILWVCHERPSMYPDWTIAALRVHQEQGQKYLSFSAEIEVTFDHDEVPVDYQTFMEACGATSYNDN